MQAGDIEAVVELVVRCDRLISDWAPAGWQLPDGHAEHELGVWREELALDRFRAEVACEAGAIAGVVATKGSLADEGPGSGHITSLFVDPRAHGRGLGAALLARAEAWLRDDGCDRATLSVLSGSPAIGFYEAQGWIRDGRIRHYDEFDLPTIGFAKPL